MKWLMSFSPDENVPITFFYKKTENTENTAGDHMLCTLQLYYLPDATGETATTKQSPKCNQKINHITQMDCKLREESNEPN